jgi:hypothetical protein
MSLESTAMSSVFEANRPILTTTEKASTDRRPRFFDAQTRSKRAGFEIWERARRPHSERRRRCDKKEGCDSLAQRSAIVMLA